MRRVGKNAFTEVYFWGCNPSFVVTNDGVVMIDTPQEPIDALRWRETMLQHGPIRYLINTEPHGDHISGNAYFPGVEVVAQEGLKARYEAAIPQMLSEDRVQRLKETDPDSVWLLNHPDYPPNPPTKTFDKALTLHLGNHTFQITHTCQVTPSRRRPSSSRRKASSSPATTYSSSAKPSSRKPTPGSGWKRYRRWSEWTST